MSTVLISGHAVHCDTENLDLLKDAGWGVIKNGGLYVGKIKRELGKYASCELFHRVIMNCPLGMQVDHINGNTLDNRKSNLRICTVGENARNRKTARSNTSGFTGVTFDPGCPGKPWRAEIRVDGKKIYIGHFETDKEASFFRYMAELENFGEFTRRLRDR